MHDGYRRLGRRNDHTRQWTLESGSLRIADQIAGRVGTAEAWLHLHPAVAARASAPRTITLTWPGGSATVAFEGAAAVDVRAGTWHPRFGSAVPNQCIVAQFAGDQLATRLSWE